MGRNARAGGTSEIREESGHYPGRHLGLVWHVPNCVSAATRHGGVVLVSAGEPARRPGLDDVAAEVGVSPATVSLVLRGIPGPSAATRERVLEAAARLGYRPDRAASVLASRRSRLIGLVMDVSNPFHAQLVGEVH